MQADTLKKEIINAIENRDAHRCKGLCCQDSSQNWVLRRIGQHYLHFPHGNPLEQDPNPLREISEIISELNSDQHPIIRKALGSCEIDYYFNYFPIMELSGYTQNFEALSSGRSQEFNKAVRLTQRMFHPDKVRGPLKFIYEALFKVLNWKVEKWQQNLQ